MRNLVILLISMVLLSCSNTKKENRVTQLLNGNWQLAKTGLVEEIPIEYTAEVPVPGLVDLATPVLDEQDTLYENSRYWYKTSFSLNHESFDVVRLKINKAKYHAKVYLNNKYIGENYYNFTPTTLNIKPFLLSNGKKNDLVISLGCKNNLPDTVIKGNDFEKLKYIPGIYDDVKIIMANKPFLEKVQIAPNLEDSNIRVMAHFDVEKNTTTANLKYTIREVSSKKIVTQDNYKCKIDQENLSSDFTIPIANYKPWTPESPFLYELTLNTNSDSKSIRFGMRSFKTSGKYAKLNDSNYLMRGTNVCIFRFFEDPERNRLPWKKEWVIQLHNKFKEMHWNTIRYCIGFPPEMWYHVADSLGFLIQDEYPVWTATEGFPVIQPGMNSNQLAAEYKQWMQEHVNHACVVIWDAQNESVSDTIGLAINKCRDYDLSQRPWDNGWSAPASETDFIESHPYLFDRYKKKDVFPTKNGVLMDLLSDARIPINDPNERDPAEDGERYQNPIIINEYAWLWVNRNGSSTTLTDNVYKNVFPEIKSNAERVTTYAQHLGILTEYWRAHRKCAAVMHFCGLGYSRSESPRGQTSDNFIDINKLTYEPNFYQYVKPAFSPVGIMLEFWSKEIAKSSKLKFPVHIINDTYEDWEGELELALVDKTDEISLLTVSCSVQAMSKHVDTLEVNLPDTTGNYQLTGKIKYKEEEIKSIRSVVLK